MVNRKPNYCPRCKNKMYRKGGGARLPSCGYKCDDCNIVVKIYERT